LILNSVRLCIETQKAYDSVLDENEKYRNSIELLRKLTYEQLVHHFQFQLVMDVKNDATSPVKTGNPMFSDHKPLSVLPMPFLSPLQNTQILADQVQLQNPGDLLNIEAGSVCKKMNNN
jgi:hypothetical protein